MIDTSLERKHEASKEVATAREIAESDPQRTRAEELPNQRSLSRDRGPMTDRLFRLLDSEIDRILTHQTRQGWTSWAILAALGGTLWLLVKTLDSPAVTLGNYLRVYLIVWLLIDTLHLILALLAWQPSSDFKTDRFRPPSFVANRLVWLLRIVLSAALIAVALRFDTAPSWTQTACVVVFYALYAAFALLYLVLDLLRTPLQITPGAFSRRIALVFLTVAMIGSWGCFGVLRTLFIGGVTTDDWRLGGLLAVAMILVLRLAERASDPPLLGSLIETQRSLSLGEIELETAMYQVDIALRGMRVTDVLQVEIRTVLVRFEEIQRECNFIKYEIEALKSSLIIDGRALNENETMVSTTVYKSTVEHYVKIVGLLKTLREAIAKLVKRLGRIPTGSPQVQNDLNSLITALSNEEQRLQLQVNETEDLISGLKVWLEQNGVPRPNA